jgi:very-short-patch-repair endonuclease
VKETRSKAKLSATQKARWAAGVYDFHRVDVDWVEAQRLYDKEDLSFRDLAKRIGVNRNTVGNAAKDGRLIGRTRSAAMKVHCKKRDIRSEWTPEIRARQSAWRKKYLVEHPESHPNRILANMRPKISYPERRVFDWLTERGVPFEHNASVGRYFVDFLIGKLAIEVDGEYWHDAARDAVRDKNIAAFGIVVVRIPAKRVLRDGPEIVLQFTGALPSGTAPALGAGDQRFDSARPDHSL